MKKYRKIKITLIGLILAATILLMLADQAIGSCCGASEPARIEIWWWLIIGLEISVLHYVFKSK